MFAPVVSEEPAAEQGELPAHLNGESAVQVSARADIVAANLRATGGEYPRFFSWTILRGS
jgi:hypothetical protein